MARARRLLLAAFAPLVALPRAAGAQAAPPHQLGFQLTARD